MVSKLQQLLEDTKLLESPKSTVVNGNEVKSTKPQLKLYRKLDIERLQRSIESQGFEIGIAELEDVYCIGILKTDTEGNDIFLKSDMFKKHMSAKRNCIAVNNIIVKAGLSWTNLLLYVYNEMGLYVPWPVEEMEEFKKLMFDAIEAHYVKPKVLMNTQLGGDI
jgi:hypothetical protein